MARTGNAHLAILFGLPLACGFAGELRPEAVLLCLCYLLRPSVALQGSIPLSAFVWRVAHLTTPIVDMVSQLSGAGPSA